MKTTTLDRSEIAALRHVAIMAVSRAFPHAAATHIAQALSIDHGTVLWHRQGKFKGPRMQDASTWQKDLESACRAIGSGNFAQAASDLGLVCTALAALSAPAVENPHSKAA